MCLMTSLTFSTVENENSSSSANNNLSGSGISVSNTIADSQFQKMEADTISKDSILVKCKSSLWGKKYGKLPLSCSWYGNKHSGNRMFNGEVFNENNLTCAAPKRVPIGSRIKITNLDNNKVVIVRVTDRGGFATKNPNKLDLSKGAFKKIASKGVGEGVLVNVKFELLL